ncbi:MAG: DUF445 domain-containing protein [Actinobacteria bacterium]|nr:DUF445 domain-containing protein [Actinomycetota bacterium]
MSIGFHLTADDEQRLADLRTMRRLASLVLLGATIVFVIARVLEVRVDEAWGYLRATAEAAMVGGIADWFAVTALFRHPLGIPIPHTAILPSRKDQLGKTFGGFVQGSFLAPAVLAERLEHLSVSDRAAEWLLEPGNAELAAERAGALAATVVRLLPDEEVGDLLTNDVLGRLNHVDVAPLAAQVLDIATEDGRHHQLLDAVLKGLGDMMRDQRVSLRQRFMQESPWWVPEAVDDKVFDKIYAGLNTFIAEIRSNPNHEVRQHVDAKARELAVKFRESPELVERANQVKADVLANPAVRDWVIDVWGDVREAIIAQAAAPDSTMRIRLAEYARTMAERLRDDDELRTKVDEGARAIAVQMAERYGAEVAGFVETTVQRWDAAETTARVEVLLGRDLQIIRINGSVVGGLAGLVIYSLSQLLS